jgi:AGCS family alanine or glycine:cation symporter
MLVGGIGRIARVSEILMPVMALLFLGSAVAVLWLCRSRLPGAMVLIVKSALTPGAAVGGVGAAAALRYGVARGLVSNEAGCGTAPIAHAAAKTASPARQGAFGVVEVFVDTVLLCTLTALVLLVSGVSPVAGGGMAYALAAYRALLGPVAVPFLAGAVLLFAFATVLCWSHYGAESMRVLTGRAGTPPLLLLAVLAACVWGAIAPPAVAWDLTDLVLGVMALLNIMALLLLRGDVIAQTRRKDTLQNSKTVLK